MCSQPWKQTTTNRSYYIRNNNNNDKIIIVQTIVINTDARRLPRWAWPAAANPLYIGYSMPESDMTTRHHLQTQHPPPPDDALQSLPERGMSLVMMASTKWHPTLSCNRS